MKSFHTIGKLSCILVGMGLIASAHADTPITSCDFDANVDNEIYFLDGDVTCTALDSYGIRIPAANNNVTIEFRGNNLNLGTAAGINGIEILGDNNEVKGKGKILGGFTSNVLISNGSNNRVTKLSTEGGTNGIRLFADPLETIQGNHIEHNMITGASLSISVFTVSGSIDDNVIHGNSIQGSLIISILVDIGSGSFDGNQIYGNSIQSSGLFGISISTVSGSIDDNVIYGNSIQGSGLVGILVDSNTGSFDGNQIYGNSIQGSGFEGVLVRTSTGSADLNSIANNKIENTGSFGINVVATSGTANQNIIFKNHVTNTGDPAIALQPNGAPGTVSLNSVSWNFAKDAPDPAYCDSSGLFNNWGINFDDLSTEFGNPGSC